MEHMHSLCITVFVINGNKKIHDVDAFEFEKKCKASIQTYYLYMLLNTVPQIMRHFFPICKTSS